MNKLNSSQLLQDGHTNRVPKLDDNLELQVALDELAAVSDQALHNYLAKQAGIDPSLVGSTRLKSTPWHVNESDQTSLSLIGELDSQLSEPSQGSDDRYNARSESTKPRWIDFTTSLETEKFGYSALTDTSKQVRLLQLGRDRGAPSEVDAYDHLELKTFDLASAPEYICLSYVWGMPERFIPIYCDGNALFVTQNLLHALKNVFSRYPDCYLWADGVCINQDDIEERACQVRLMGQIYSNCKMVIAHPGHFIYAKVDDDEGLPNDRSKMDGAIGLSQKCSSLAPSDIEGLEISNSRNEAAGSHHLQGDDEEPYDISPARAAVSLMNFIQRIWASQKDYEISLDSAWAQYGLPSSEGRDSEIWQSLFEFWEQDWLWRAWVLPECVLPSRVIIMFGDKHVVSLDAAMKFWENAHKRGLPAVLRHGNIAHLFLRIMHLTPVTTFLTLRNQRTGTEDAETPNSISVSNSDAQPASDKTGHHRNVVWKETPDLLKLLILSRGNRATDDRDKVYALLGLTDDPISQSIRPDYHESNTVQQTFIDVARRYVETDRGTELVESAGLDHRIGNLPSWVPDWTHQSRSKLDAHLYSASRDLRNSVRIADLNSDQLSLQGISISKVEMCGRGWCFYSDDIKAPTFAPFRTRAGGVVDMPPFSDEDARCFILTFALGITEDLYPRTSELYPAGVEQAIVRTLTADRSWSGRRLSSSEVVMEHIMNSYRSFRKFHARGPDDDPDQPHLKPGFPMRVHMSGVFHWLLISPKRKGTS